MSDTHCFWINPHGKTITADDYAASLDGHLDGLEKLQKTWKRRGQDIEDETIETALDRRWVMVRHDRLDNSIYVTAKQRLTPDTIEVLRRLLLGQSYNSLYLEGPEDRRPKRVQGPRELLDVLHQNRLT
jgi:hypothetical protein